MQSIQTKREGMRDRERGGRKLRLLDSFTVIYRFPNNVYIYSFFRCSLFNFSQIKNITSIWLKLPKCVGNQWAERMNERKKENAGGKKGQLICINCRLLIDQTNIFSIHEYWDQLWLIELLIYRSPTIQFAPKKSAHTHSHRHINTNNMSCMNNEHRPNSLGQTQLTARCLETSFN